MIDIKTLVECTDSIPVFMADYAWIIDGIDGSNLHVVIDCTDMSTIKLNKFSEMLNQQIRSGTWSIRSPSDCFVEHETTEVLSILPDEEYYDTTSVLTVVKNSALCQDRRGIISDPLANQRMARILDIINEEYFTYD
jgi:hypothetical protein